ncbi:hypothetical protein TBLA_0E03380 [Henningerozyma blattae CBS 6284]|uniref:Large ribosomal subunit protein mL59 domain-containing protein n=1 Tax=Henningerozyma blattae (strain ATCC 34711 / CBS 6284 / DSM 70876 / NBRC 10599 / NRRL Y-10934 / UCD 77-7) TaxID=1071380 RepID=I2H4U0_HENB6|nr:hypothetical protein TBLA_0E03380 [Tetrapisispora blattae CBS 6284]CCH61392.1 hypothetical protein TBLA_0E03380 [Tetrapisispora blattae CBS 6284]
MNRQYFDKLPTKLKNFFHKYPPSITYSNKPTSTYDITANPFLPNKHPISGKHHNPKYSLRRLSVLYKEAYKFGITELLPPIPNKSFFLEKYENKPMMRGVLRPKGHKHELNKAERDAKKAKGIANIDAMLIKYRGKSYERKLEKKKSEKITYF